MERRERLLQGLPVRTGEETIRRWRRADMDELAAWPEYGYPCAGFEFSFQRASAEERDEVFRERLSDPRRITLVAEAAPFSMQLSRTHVSTPNQRSAMRR